MRSRVLVPITFAVVVLTIGTPAPQAPQASQAAQDSVDAQLAAHAASAATADPGTVIPISPLVRHGSFDNGLRYFVRENREPEGRAELRLVVNAGSILEDADQLGLAHFVEHMAFNGTANFAKQELIGFMESIGMRMGPHVNAYTSFDETVYMLQLPTADPATLATGFQILEDWAHGLTLDDDEIDNERGVVIEEWRLGQGAFDRISDQQLPIVLQGSRYAERLPIGSKESLESASYDALRRFYRDWYRPDLMTVIAVGDFDGDAVEAAIQEHFAALPAAASPRPRAQYDIPDHDETLFAIATDPELPMASISIQHKLPVHMPEHTLAEYREGFVENLYSQMLNRRLGELGQQADPPFTFAGTGKGNLLRARSAYSVTVGVKPDAMIEGLEAAMAEVARVQRHGFTGPELERLKVGILRGMQRAYDERDNRSSRGFAAEYVRLALSGEPAPGIEYEFELARRFLPTITLDEVNAAADGWIREANRVVTVSAPEKEGVTVPEPAELLAALDRVDAMELAVYTEELSDAPLLATDPVPGAVVATRSIEGTEITEWTLANGVRVALLPTDYKNDEVVVRAISPGGTSLVSDDDWVAASSAAQLVGAGGLGSFNRIDLGKKLAGTAARASTFIGAYGEGLSGTASPQDFETLMQLIHLQFTAPRADPDAFESIRSRTRTGLENQTVMPQVAFSLDLRRLLAQGHPRQRSLSVELLEEWDLERSLAIYRERFADADDFTFVFVGALDLDAVRPLIERYLGSLPSQPGSETWRDVGIRQPEGVIERKFYRGVEPQSQTRMMFHGPFEYGEQANRTTIRAMAAVLQSRLRDVLREQLGATYGVGVNAGYGWRPEPGYTVSINFASDPERAEELIDQVFLQIETLKTEGPSDDDVADVREAFLRTLETDRQSNSWWAAQISFRYEQGDVDFSNLSHYPETVEQLSPAAIQEAARQYFDLKRYVLATLYPESVDDTDR